jgi:large subunit ribosomal protein L9
MAEATKLAGKLKKVKLKLTLATGQGGKSFGAITTMDIAKGLQDQAGIEIDRHQIVLERPIKNTGNFDVEIKLGYDITTEIKLSVAASGDKAAEGDDSGDEKAAE